LTDQIEGVDIAGLDTGGLNIAELEIVGLDNLADFNRVAYLAQ